MSKKARILHISSPAQIYDLSLADEAACMTFFTDIVNTKERMRDAKGNTKSPCDIFPQLTCIVTNQQLEYKVFHFLMGTNRIHNLFIVALTCDQLSLSRNQESLLRSADRRVKLSMKM